MGLEKDGDIVIRGLLDASGSELIFRYVLLRHETGTMSVPDDTIPSAPRLYADPLTESLLLMSQPHVERFVGAELWPAYSYARLHGSGASMPIHLDREASEVAVS